MSPERRKIVLTTEWPKAAMDALRGDYELVVALGGPGSADFAAALTGAEAFCPVYYDRIDSALIAALPASIRIIASFGVGTDHIDLQAAAKRGLPVSNTPDVLTDDTADIAIGLMIAASRGFSEREGALRAGQWKGPSITGDLWQSFSSKTLGIVGLGRIGAAVARRAKAFGMRLLYTSPSHKPALEEELGLAYREHLSELLADSDFVSLHTPLNASTRHLIDAGRLAQMKSSGVLVNTGRGALVDEAALAEALKTGVIFAAGLDVYEDEPRVQAELLRCPNAVLLPHIGSATEETRTAMGLRVKENLDAFFAAGQPIDPVSG